MNTNLVHEEQFTYMSAPHSDIDALCDFYISRHLTRRVLAKNHELYARFASFEPLDRFDLYAAQVAGERARKEIYPPIRGRK